MVIEEAPMPTFTNEIAKRCARWILLETSPAPLPMLHPVRDDMAAAADEIERLSKLVPAERPEPFMMLSCREAKQCLHQIPGCICDGDPTA
jgi:hypothetical protein